LLAVVKMLEDTKKIKFNKDSKAVDLKLISKDLLRLQVRSNILYLVYCKKRFDWDP
jgi:hypothetical protein